MPTIVIYNKKQQFTDYKKISKELKPLVAELLTCGDITLSTKEISVRVVELDYEDMIGDMEIEIKAHAYRERIIRQDEICNKIRDHVMKKNKSIGDVRVWLILSELGHSWD